jgi:hypothetical protein
MRAVSFAPGRIWAVAVALFIASLISVPSFPKSAAAWLISNPQLSVNRALKGDRLPRVVPRVRWRELGLPKAPMPSQSREKAPIGCDGAFSTISTPRQVNVFGRCTV